MGLNNGVRVDELPDEVLDPFLNALFDDCDPLFDKDENCNVELLNECGSD